jgi:hypothetical protein
MAVSTVIINVSGIISTQIMGKAAYDVAKLGRVNWPNFAGPTAITGFLGNQDIIPKGARVSALKMWSSLIYINGLCALSSFAWVELGDEFLKPEFYPKVL